MLTTKLFPLLVSSGNVLKYAINTIGHGQTSVQEENGDVFQPGVGSFEGLIDNCKTVPREGMKNCMKFWENSTPRLRELGLFYAKVLGSRKCMANYVMISGTAL